MKITDCYIEEYENGQGQPSARLREKVTGRKVDLGTTTDSEAQHFLNFLRAAQANRALMPDAFSKEGDDDSISVSGDVDFDAPDEIRYIHNANLSYLFA
ncbi:hypothetical protein [Herbiconiux liangxiaofengii]|uniref:hypothetical protein n=1 Tax=Herbiconiux liangxiaofengii TaxID=3342795 RepID=UPI0035B94EA2